MRHVGRHTVTDKPVIVLWMLIPEQTSNALVIYPEDIRDGTLRRELILAVEGNEGQQAETFADIAGRRYYADSGKSILQALHESGQLIATPIDEIVMTPEGNHRIPLRAVLEAINRLPNAHETATKFNPHQYNNLAIGQNEQIDIAKNMLVEAELLESDALRKREQAYSIAPSLRPAQDPAPAVVAPAAPKTKKAKSSA